MELLRALAVLAEPPTPEARHVWRALPLPGEPTPGGHAEVFVVQLPPHGALYLGSGGLGGEPRDRISGFWRALGLDAPEEPDHLASMLGSYAALCETTAEPVPGSEAMRHARKAYLWEHLLSWLPCYLRGVRSLGVCPYDWWAAILLDALLTEADELGPVDILPLHLRDVPALCDPRRQPTSEFLRALLTPACSGLILSRAALVRCAHEVGLGIRIADRLTMLKSLLEQDAASALGWLGEETAEWSRHFEALRPRLGFVADHWGHRAGATAVLLRDLQKESVAG